MNTPSFYKHFFSSLLYFFPPWSCTFRWDKLVQRHQIDLVVGLRSVFVKILIHLETSFRTTGINAKRKKKPAGIHQCRATTAKASAKSGRNRVFTNVPFCPRDANCGMYAAAWFSYCVARKMHSRFGAKVNSFV